MTQLLKLCASIFLLVGGVTHASETYKPTHYIVWIHGIGGNAHQSGFMKPTLERHLPVLNGSMQYKVLFFDYATKDDTLTYEDFKKSLDEYLKNQFLAENPLRRDDKISLVAHSQGGLISMLWLQASCFDRSNPSYAICSKIVSLTTLGTPFWGSRIANIGETLKKWIGSIWFLKDFGMKQLEALNVASPAIFNFRDFMESNQSKFSKLFNERIRFMIVAGRSSLFDILSPLFPGQRVEDDLGTPVTSSGMKYWLYSGQLLNKSQHTQTENIQAFNYKYVVVDALHIPQMANLLRDLLGENVVQWLPDVRYPSLIDVPKECVLKSLKSCGSPSIQYIAENILGMNSHIQNDPLVTFAVQLRIKASNSDEINRFIRFKVKERNESMKVGKWTEPYSDVRRMVGDTVYGYITGSDPSLKEKSRKVEFEIYYGNTLIHQSLLPVSPGGMTFVDLKLDDHVVHKLYENMDKSITPASLNQQLGIIEEEIL